MAHDLDETTDFKPKLNDDGLISCIVQDVTSKNVLMFAWMNLEALEQTLKSREMHYWSRSRQSLWHKGATSGGIQTLHELRIDCDQDCLLALVSVNPDAEDQTCHTGRKNCFYRQVISEDGAVSLRFEDP